MLDFEGTQRVQVAGAFEQVNPADFLQHWVEEFESDHGISIESILNVNFVDIQERIDISMDKDGFHLDIVPLGTNFLDYRIDVREGATFVEAEDLPFATRGKVEDFAFLDILGDDFEIEGRDVEIRYDGVFVAPQGGIYLFDLASVGRSRLAVDGVPLGSDTQTADGKLPVQLREGQHVDFALLLGFDETDASPTRRTDDDLKLGVEFIPFGDGAAAQDMEFFDHVRTANAPQFDVKVAWAPGQDPRFNSAVFSVEELSDVFDAFDELSQDVIGREGREFYDLTITADGFVTIAEAGDYQISNPHGGQDQDARLRLRPAREIEQIDFDHHDDRPADAPSWGFGAMDITLRDGEATSVSLEAGAYEVSYTYGAFAGFELEDDPSGLLWSGPATGGHERALFQEKPKAVTDGLIETLNEGLETLGQTIGSVEELLLFLQPSPVKVVPTWDFRLGIDAELGWDIELPKMGRTATTQPVTFELIVDEKATRGETITAQITDLTFLQPQTRSHLLELGDVDFDAGFGLPETGLSGLGFYLGTKALPVDRVDEILGADSALARLNHALDDMLGLTFRLDANFTLGEIVDIAGKAAGAAGLAYDPEKGLSFTEFLQGLYSGETSITETLDEFTGFLREGDYKGAFELMIRIAGLAPDEEEDDEADPDAPAHPGYPMFDIDTADGRQVQIAPHEVLGVARDASLAGSNGKRTVEVVDETLGAVFVEVQAVETLLEETGIADVFSKIAQVFEGGIELIPGVEVAADVGIGKTYEGWGWDATPGSERTDETRDGADPIVMHTTVDLFDVEVDLREVMFDGLAAAFDGPLGAAASANPEFELAKIAAELAPILLEKLEEGGSAELNVNHGPVIHEVVKIALDLIDGLVGRINQLVDLFVPGHFDALEINISENELFDAAFDDPATFKVKFAEAMQPAKDHLNAAVQALEGFVKDVLSGFVSAGREVLSVIHTGQAHIRDVEHTLEDALDSALKELDIFLNPDDEAAAFLSLVGIETTERNSVYTVDRDAGLLGELDHLIDTPDALDGLLDKAQALVDGFEIDLTGPIDALVDGVGDFVPELLAPIHARADLDLDLFELVTGMELDLTQTTTFHPEEVEVEYSFGSQTQRVAYGEAVTFDVPDAGAGDAVTATLIYDGAYEYAYELTPKFDVDMTVLGFSVDAVLEHGDDTLFDEVLEYALVETVEGKGTKADLLAFVTETAVLELNADAIDQELLKFFDAVVAGPMRDAFGTDGAETALGGIPFGTSDAFAPDADAAGNTFTTLSATASVDVLGTPVLVAGPNGGTLQGTDVDERFEGSRRADVMLGRGGNDEMSGEGGDDVLRGFAGDDVLAGGTGDDVLQGGNGADRFVFKGVFGRDVIADFEPGTDKIDLSSYDGQVRNGLSFERLHLGGSDLGTVVQADLDQNGNPDRFDFNRDGARDIVEIVLRGVSPDELSASDFIF